MALPRPGVIKTIGTTVGRRRRDEQLSPEEEEKRRIRRERNKLAAAKCRNRRRELTEKLQAETEELEEEKSGLQKEIAELQKEKEKLEFMLVAHGPVCKISPEERRSPPASGLPSLRGGGGGAGAVVVKQEPLEEDSPSSSSAGLDKAQRSVIKPISIAGGLLRGGAPAHPHRGDLHASHHSGHVKPRLHLPQRPGAGTACVTLRVLLQGSPPEQ